MKAKVVENLCIGCGACASLVPDMFELQDDGVACCKKNVVDKTLEEYVKTAADNCPTGAINLEEE